jgi:signal transduction histidine kinase
VLLSTDEPDAMMRGLFARIAPHFSLDAYFNFTVNEAHDALRLSSCIGIPEEAARAISRLEFGQAVCGSVARLWQPIVATRIQQSDDPKVRLVKSFGIRAYACNPLLAGDRLLGTLSFASRSRDEFDPEELDFLRTICHYVTAAYERLRLIRQLQEADRRKDEFLAMLAHELRNPLAPIRNAAQVIRLLGPADANLQRAREMIERQVLHLSRLVDDLLDVSRITRGKITLQKDRLDLAAVVAQAVETSAPLIQARGHKLTISLPQEPVCVAGDATRLAQVVSNLLNNAAKYTPDGGHLALTVEVASPPSTPLAPPGRGVGGEGWAVVRVRDDGVGIAADLLPQVFDLFTQGDRSLARSEGGLGIGLSMVRTLVEMHGGTVAARSAGPGKGSEFIVRLPTFRSQESGVRGQAVLR